MKRPHITPGPWKDIEGFITGKFSDGKYHDVCDPRCAPPDDDDVFAEMNANAVAIAAVPDLLEALQLLTYGAEQAVANGLNQPQVNGGLVLARAALTKAGYTF